MTKIYLTSLLLTLAIGATAQENDIFRQPAKGFRSWQPAVKWEDALLAGNGTMGALVMGQPDKETIMLSHNALYLPQKRSPQLINQAPYLDSIRRLMLKGKYQEAANIPQQLRTAADYSDNRDPFMPAFDLLVQQATANIHHYNRTVNFETGEASVNWQDDHGSYQRRLFISRADSVIVLQVKGTGKINGSFSFAPKPVNGRDKQLVADGVASTQYGAGNKTLYYRSTFKNLYPATVQGYEGLGRMIVKGGSATIDGNWITVKDADEVLLLVKITPLYDSATQATATLQQQLNTLPGDYNALLQKHTTLHSALFNRVHLRLGAPGADSSLDAESLVQKAHEAVTPGITQRIFDAARYNIICATGTNPPNLQGLWSGTWNAPWSGGMTNDGNLPTAISSLLGCNTPELMHAFFNYHLRMMDQYRYGAKRLYNTRGIHIPAQTTTTGIETDFGPTWCLTFWTGAAGWAASYFYDYYQYTGDKQFLKETAYPFMKEAALFYEDFLTKDASGKLIFNPSYSPENDPVTTHSQAALNATMDVMIAKQLLRNCIRAADLLQTDKAQKSKWQQMIGNMPAYAVTQDGTLREWLWPGLEENYQHRHSSHLYALYDEVAPEFASDTTLRNGALKAIEKRMQFRIAEHGGEMAFGQVQLALSSAHLGDAGKAKIIADWLTTYYWSNSLASYHNPGDLFNTDISGGLPYVITQMLTYSEQGKINLLPALPQAWSTGAIDGLQLRGAIKLNQLHWQQNKVNASLTSLTTQQVTISLPGSITALTIDGKKAAYKGNAFSLTLPAGKTVAIDIIGAASFAR